MARQEALRENYLQRLTLMVPVGSLLTIISLENLLQNDRRPPVWTLDIERKHMHLYPEFRKA
jgi:hypothetical protein